MHLKKDQCIPTVRHMLVECNHFAEERKDIFGGRDVMQSFRFHPTLVLFYLKECQFYDKLESLYQLLIILAQLFSLFIS